jgi:hypothetical protein
MAIIKPNNNTISAITALPAAIPTGKVLQVVTATSGQATTNSTSYSDTGLTASITPASSSNKILVTVHLPGQKYNTHNEVAINLKLLRGSTELDKITDYGGFTDSSVFAGFCYSMVHLDSPSSTSSTTYKVTFASTVASHSVYVGNNSGACTISLMEISA